MQKKTPPNNVFWLETTCRDRSAKTNRVKLKWLEIGKTMQIGADRFLRLARFTDEENSVLSLTALSLRGEGIRLGGYENLPTDGSAFALKGCEEAQIGQVLATHIVDGKPNAALIEFAQSDVIGGLSHASL